MDEINDEMFGVLILNKYEEDEYKAKYYMDDEEIEVTIEYDLVKELDILKEYLKNFDENIEIIKEEGIFEKIKELKNNEWLDASESLIEHNQVIKRIKLKGIEFYGNCTISLIFNDDDIFFGKDIVVDIRGYFYSKLNISYRLE